MTAAGARGTTHARVCAIVVNWNGDTHLPSCIASLQAQTEPVDIVVIDNASTDDSARVLAATDGIRVIANDTNRGFAGGANDGLAATEHPFVLLANPDVVFAPDHVAHLLAAIEGDDRCGSVQGLLVRQVDGFMPEVEEAVVDSAGHAVLRNRLFRNRGEGEPAARWGSPSEVFGVTGAAALHRRAMLDDVAVESAGKAEVFDETFFAWFEDLDLDWRARLRGWTAWCDPRAVAWHERGGIGPRRTPLVEELNFANRLLLLAKHDVFDPGALLPALAATLAKAILVGPLVLWAALRRVRRGWSEVRSDRRLIRARASVTAREVVNRWVEPSWRWRPRGRRSR